MPRWREFKRFCERDGWELYKRTDHDHYRKVMPDGTLKLTKVSRGSGEIPRGVWRRILRRQLQVGEEYFNRLI